MIVPIGDWVLREACRQVVAWSNEGLPVVSLAVNLSAIQFRNESFLASVFAILAETGLAPGLLELELTESVFLKNGDATVAILDALRDRGMRIAIDDFGTGYSSLGYLHRFPLDALKIDRSFVQQISTGAKATSIVKAIISMGTSLGLRVIAEGIETPAQLAFLRTCGCDEGQGFLIGHPVPHERFANLLRDGPPALAKWSTSAAHTSHDDRTIP